MKSVLPPSDDELARLLRRAAALADAPADQVQAAIDGFAKAPWRQAAAPNPLKRWLATLSFDSWAVSPLALGMRGLATPTRHLLFSAAGRDVDLRIAPDGEGFALSGQILGPDGAGRVELGADGAAPRSAELDDLGEFRLEGVAAGRYSLSLRVGDDQIELPPIDVGARK